MLATLLERRPENQNEQLLKLYWNRAGVKRELKQLRRERGDLLDKLKDQEASIIRAQEQLEGLERLLTNPLAAANAMVYFQLRHLWRLGAQRLEQLSVELQGQRERRERAQLQEAALAKRRRRLEAVDEKLQSLLVKRHTVTQEIASLEGQITGLGALSRVLRGPRLKRRLAGLSAGNEMLVEKIEGLKDLKDKIEGEPLPEPEGLSVESRRLINTAVIALAQYLVVHFSEHNLASMARDATHRPVADMKFGDRRDCDRLVERIRERIEGLRQQKDLADQVKRRADQLLGQLKYRGDTDSVPVLECVETIRPVPTRPGEAPARRETDAPVRINVLSEEYWDLFEVLR
jgi:hypothetical protein